MKGLRYLSFAIALNRASILILSPKMVKTGELGFRKSVIL